MPRPKGSRDRDYDIRRQALIASTREHLSSAAGRNASWRDLAAAGGVSVSTMNHYFGSRSALIAAILEQAQHEGTSYLAMTKVPSGPFADSIADLVTLLSRGLRHGVLALQVIGLGEGFADGDVSSAYLGHHLEPILGAIATRLEAHMALGEMTPANARFAAIGLLSPLLVAHLHQDTLGGQTTYPMPLDDFAREHAESFVKAYAAQGALHVTKAGKQVKSAQ